MGKIAKIALTIFLVVMGIMAVCNLVGNSMLRSVTIRLNRYLAQGDFDKFEKLLNSWPAKVSIRPAKRYLMKLNAAIVREDDAEVESIVAVFEDLGMDPAEQRAVYSNAFYYYVNRDNEEKATRYYRRLNEIPNFKSYGVDRFYNTMVLKRDDFLRGTLEELPKADPRERPTLESLISIMYRNRGDEAKYQEYQELSEKHLKELLEDDLAAKDK